MTKTIILKSSWLLSVAAVLLGCVVGWSVSVQAQICPATAVAGNNTVYETCSGTATAVGSKAFIDASAVTGTSGATDICAKINAALSAATTKGGTGIDARGISGANLICPAGVSPWKYPSTGTVVTTSSIILLPAGTITLSTSWAVADQTQIIGEGPSLTVLQASSVFTDPYYDAPHPAMIHMGTPSSTNAGSTGKIFFGIKISHLTLDAQGHQCNSPCSAIYLDGIDNLNAEEQSYVDDVTIQNVEGTGLFLGQDSGGRNFGAADHSGPYTNIIFQQAPPCTGCMTQTSTACVNVYSGVQPRGIYGITCTADTTPAAAIILDGSNVTIENARLDGFTDGILIGDHPVAGQGLAQADLLFNVLSANSTGNTTANLIHICCSPPSSSTPVNVTVMGATSAAGNTIKDELTSTTLTNSSDPHVGLYVLGHPIYNSSSVIEGYSRFSTSPRFPAWIVGSTTAAISGSCSNGSLFSSTTGTGGTLWTCVSTSWSKIQ